MLPAKKQEARPETPQNSPVSSTMGFGKVLTSIQGLQQRLEDFSVEDVVRTEGNAKSLVLELSQLQIKLETLAALKQFVASANLLISEIPEENFEQIAPDGLENHPQLHAIIQASKLIRLHRLMRAYIEGIQYAKTHRKETMEILAKYLRTDDKDILDDTYESIIQTLVPEKPYPTLKGIQIILREFGAKDPTARSARPEQFVDLSIMLTKKIAARIATLRLLRKMMFCGKFESNAQIQESR